MTKGLKPEYKPNDMAKLFWQSTDNAAMEKPGDRRALERYFDYDMSGVTCLEIDGSNCTLSIRGSLYKVPNEAVVARAREFRRSSGRTGYNKVVGYHQL